MLNQKGLAHIFFILILLVGIVTTVFLAGKTQIFKPKASGENVTWILKSEDPGKSCVEVQNGKKVATCPTVEFNLISPLETNQSSDATPNISLVKTAYAAWDGTGGKNGIGGLCGTDPSKIYESTRFLFLGETEKEISTCENGYSCTLLQTGFDPNSNFQKAYCAKNGVPVVEGSGWDCQRYYGKERLHKDGGIHFADINFGEINIDCPQNYKCDKQGGRLTCIPAGQQAPAPPASGSSPQEVCLLSPKANKNGDPTKDCFICSGNKIEGIRPYKTEEGKWRTDIGYDTGRECPADKPCQAIDPGDLVSDADCVPQAGVEPSAVLTPPVTPKPVTKCTPVFKYNECIACNESHKVYTDSCTGAFSAGPAQNDPGCASWCQAAPAAPVAPAGGTPEQKPPTPEEKQPANQAKRTTRAYRLAEDATDVLHAPWQSYTVGGTKVQHTFLNYNPGLKTIYIQFLDDRGNVINATPLTVTIELVRGSFEKPGNTSSNCPVDSYQNYDIPTLKQKCSLTDLSKLPTEALKTFSNSDLLDIAKSVDGQGGPYKFLSQFDNVRLSSFDLEVLKKLPEDRINSLPPALKNAVTGQSSAAETASCSSIRISGNFIVTSYSGPGDVTTLKIWIASNDDIGKAAGPDTSWTLVKTIPQDKDKKPVGETVPLDTTGFAKGKHAVLMSLHGSFGQMLDGNPNNVVNLNCATTLTVQ